MAKRNDKGEKLIKIRLPKERREQEDVFVGINERTWLIKRGVEVEVPECVAGFGKSRDDAGNHRGIRGRGKVPPLI